MSNKEKLSEATLDFMLDMPIFEFNLFRKTTGLDIEIDELRKADLKRKEKIENSHSKP